MPVAESAQKKTKPAWSFLPEFLDRMFLGVEDFAGRLLDLLANTAEGIAARVMHRFYGLFFMGVAIVLILVGVARVLDAVFRFPGMGEMIVGIFLLLATSMVLLSSHRRP